MDRLKDKAHLVMLGVGLLNIAVLPFWRLPLAKATIQAVGYPLFGLGLALSLLSFLALKRGVSGRVEPVTELVTGGIYARLRHPMYASFAVIMLTLDGLLGSVSGIVVTFFAFLPSMVWRARLEEQALARRFGETWKDYAESVPSLLLWDFRKRGK
ncbi:MAG: isoprenylcysteine carboxylmethyltransferase family protein [Anaerolineae bacterium]|nr:isoprenylcysteine carboxylmethyltransferase family protein [Anaerolineae bacterium]